MYKNVLKKFIGFDCRCFFVVIVVRFVEIILQRGDVLIFWYYLIFSWRCLLGVVFVFFVSSVSFFSGRRLVSQIIDIFSYFIYYESKRDRQGQGFYLYLLGFRLMDFVQVLFIQYIYRMVIFWSFFLVFFWSKVESCRRVET